MIQVTITPPNSSRVQVNDLVTIFLVNDVLNVVTYCLLLLIRLLSHNAI